MKKIFLLVTMGAFVINTYAQDDSINNRKGSYDKKDNTNQIIQEDRMNQKGNERIETHPDGVMMQGGRIVIVRNGEMTSMEKEMTLKDGTRVMTDGTVIKNDGTKMMMKEGQHLNMSGNIENSKNKGQRDNNWKKKNNDMYIVPDSTIKK